MRPLALLLSAALVLGQASSAVPAFAQTVMTGGQSVPVVTIAPVNAALPRVPGALIQTPSPTTTLVLSPTLLTPIAPLGAGRALPAATRGLPASGASRGSLAQGLARGTLRAGSVAGAVSHSKEAAPGAGAADGPQATARTSAEQAREGVRDAVASPSFWQTFWHGGKRAPGAQIEADVAGRTAETKNGLTPSGAADDSGAARGEPPAPPGFHAVAPALALGAAQAASQYGLAAAVLAGTWGAARLARRAAAWLARSASESTRKAVSTMASLGTWIAGLLAASHIAGIDYHTAVNAFQKVDAIPAVHNAIPYALAILVLLFTKPAARLARRLADKLADRGGWKAGTRLLARHSFAWATWLIGAVAASQVAGIDPSDVAKTFQITTLAMSLALKDFLGNLIQGGVLLLSHPFDIGDHVRIEKVDYTVVTMTLREVQLTKDGGKTIKHYLYSDLAALPIITFKPYVSGRSFVQLRRPELKVSDLPTPNRGWWRAATFGALGLGLAVPGAIFVHPWLITAMPWLYAMGIAVGTFFAARAMPRWVDRFAKKRGWPANETTLARIGATLLTIALGGGAALRVLGTTWIALGTSVGVTAVVITIAATALIESTIAYLTVLGAQPFTLDDHVVFEGLGGTIVDITPRLVVVKLDEPAEAYMLVPIGLFSKFETPGKPLRRQGSEPTQ